MLQFKQRLPFKGVAFLSAFALVFAISHASISPIFPLFIKGFVGKDAYVGYILSSFAVLFLLTNMVIGKVLTSFKKKIIMSLALFFLAVSYFLFTRIDNIYQLIEIETIRTISLASYGICLALFIRESTNKKSLGKTEGTYYALLNVAWLIGPLVGGLIARAYGLEKVFYLSFIISSLAFIVFLIYKPKENNHYDSPSDLLGNIRLFFKNKDAIKTYLVSLGLVCYLMLQYIYLPLLIKSQGFGEDLIGYALAGLVIPLIILEIPAGKLADRFGYRRFFIFGFSIISLCLILIYFVSSIYWLILLVVLSSIGAAFIEPLKEGCFFKLINKKEELKLYPIFRTSLQLGALIGPVIYSTLLLFISLKSLFIVGGFFILLFLIPASLLKA